MSTVSRHTKYVYRSSGGASGNVEMEYGTDLGALTRMEDKIRLLHEDLESEREMRQRIEREKTDLTVQLMGMSDRLDEADGNCEHVVEGNKKREAELAKLRKMLEDVHMESEETAHHLRQKHQASISELQDQIDQLQKAKNRSDKEKQKFQSEVFELLSQVESITKDKIHYQKSVEKLEHTVSESSIRIEELSRNVNEITASKVRLSTENSELTKEIHEIKIHMDNAIHMKTQLATQLEQSRRNLEDEERKRQHLENHSHTLEVEIESLKIQLEEESEIRLDVERQLSKAHGDAAGWRSKYEAEVQTHHDEVEELRKKLVIKIQEYEEQLEALLQKCSNLEKQKSRLQSEVEVLIMDLEKATTHAQQLEKRCHTLEKANLDLKVKIEEVTILMETAQRDARNKAQELIKLTHEYEKLREQKEILLRENKKLTDDLNDARGIISDCHRRIHEYEIEVKRLENENQELSAAYKESEHMRKQEEQKNHRLTAELAQIRHDFEKRLLQKEEELEVLRKQYQMEVENLNMRLADAEAKLKTEIQRIKKKMQIQITELEMSLDVSTKTNMELQKTIKKQSMQISDLQAHYDDLHRQMQQAMDSLGAAQRRGQALQAELDEIRITLEQTVRAKRIVETQYEESQTRINELTTININITSAKSKIESEYSALQADYDEVHKELRVADERLQKSIIELKSVKDTLVEETERFIKIETIKKTLEIEVKNLTVRLEEIEANALAGGKRVIAKLEARIRDVEIEMEEEKRRHAETQKILRKKEHRVKELLVQSEEDSKMVSLLQDSIDKTNEKVKLYKRQLCETEGSTQTNLTRVRRFQRELEAAEDRADQAESNLSMIRAKHRSWVTTSNIPGGTRQVYVSQNITEEQY